MNASTQNNTKVQRTFLSQSMSPKLRKLIVVATRDIPSLFTEWLKLEGASSDPQLRLLQPQLVQWDTERIVSEPDKLSPADIID